LRDDRESAVYQGETPHRDVAVGALGVWVSNSWRAARCDSTPLTVAVSISECARLRAGDALVKDRFVRSTTKEWLTVRQALFRVLQRMVVQVTRVQNFEAVIPGNGPVGLVMNGWMVLFEFEQGQGAEN